MVREGDIANGAEVVLEAKRQPTEDLPNREGDRVKETIRMGRTWS